MNEKLIYLAAVGGLAAIAVGFGALCYPERSSSGFGVRTSNADALAYVRASGARDMFIGVVFLYLFLRHDIGAISIVSFCTAFVGFCDFWITRHYGDKKIALVHLSATVLGVIYGLVLRAGL
jgi:hypothetical protein